MSTMQNLARLCSELQAQHRRSLFRIVGPRYEEHRFFEALAAALLAGASIEVCSYLQPGTVVVVNGFPWTPGRPAVHCASEEVRDTLLRLLAACSTRGPAS